MTDPYPAFVVDIDPPRVRRALRGDLFNAACLIISAAFNWIAPVPFESLALLSRTSSLFCAFVAVYFVLGAFEAEGSVYR